MARVAGLPVQIGRACFLMARIFTWYAWLSRCSLGLWHGTRSRSEADRFMKRKPYAGTSAALSKWRELTTTHKIDRNSLNIPGRV
ncbi:MAG: hypothetical protein GDA52_06890 [Rhodobacteraceae bacterium]|nr:hypothetical protein [Paracoccaceae bacterium]